MGLCRNASLAQCVQDHLTRYLETRGAMEAGGMYDMVLQQVEKPLLENVLQHCNGNQTRAAQVLGMNRNTLRKKLALYNLIENKE